VDSVVSEAPLAFDEDPGFNHFVEDFFQGAPFRWF
jgi:hypothetical protein